MAWHLMQLQQKYGLTVIVFTNDVRRGMRSGEMGRGALGMLSLYCKSFWYMHEHDQNGAVQMFNQVPMDFRKLSEDEFETYIPQPSKQNNAKTAVLPAAPDPEPMKREISLIDKGEKMTWDEEKELSPFSCAAAEKRAKTDPVLMKELRAKGYRG